MENDSKKELAQLKRKLSAMNRSKEDPSVEVPIEVMRTAQEQPQEPEVPTTQETAEPAENLDEVILQGRKETERMLRIENRWQIALMLLVSVLCVGIIGVLLYWLEAFLK